MATYEEIKKANEAIQPIGIEKKDKKTGQVTKKDYAEVNQRIKAFRMVYPDGFIATEIISIENGVCIIKASCGFYEEGQAITLGHGTAYEKEGSSFINQTSYIENCETSAVGRALGMAGFGIDTSVASYEEVSNAQLNQEERKATPKQVEYLKKLYTGDKLEKLLKINGIDNLEDMAMEKASMLIEKITKKGE
ncbi:MAG: hypothetical protein J6112_03480 [Clostridia bacterium]|nr:hypothetical protein [Clostridia bacterium]